MYSTICSKERVSQLPTEGTILATPPLLPVTLEEERDVQGLDRILLDCMTSRFLDEMLSGLRAVHRQQWQPLSSA